MAEEGNPQFLQRSKNARIQLPAAYYDDYDNIKTKKECNNIAFSILAIPALACSLEDILSRQYESIEDILEYHSCNALKDFDNMLLGGLNPTEEEGEE